MSNQPQPDFTIVDKKSFVDIPSSTPKNQIFLQKVGVTNRPLSLSLSTPFDNKLETLHGEISVVCSLKADQRGIHMSRIEEAIDELRNTGLSVNQFTSALANIVRTSQQQIVCEVNLAVNYEHRVNKNPSGKSSIELLKFTSQSILNNDVITDTIGVHVPFINACPCTQRWAMREFYTKLKGKGYDHQTAVDITKSAPFQAHTNRGTAKLTVESDSVTLKELYDVLDRSVPIIRELLKGPDEHAIVSQTHRDGQFCEDNIRAIIAETKKTFSSKISPDTKINIEVEVDESVHFHNIYAGVSDTLGNLD